MRINLPNYNHLAFLLFSLVVVIVLGQQLLARPTENFSAVHNEWQEVPWPFPVDAWSAGRAYRCDPSKCESEINIFIRPKIGFCSCDRGVSDDDEIDRVGDLVLIDENYTPATRGISVTFNGMTGRARRFKATSRPLIEIVGIALARKCDSIIATVVSDRKISESGEEAIIELLNSKQIKRWLDRFPQS